MLKKEATKITGGLSKPNKMPGPSINLPAVACITGAKLVKLRAAHAQGAMHLKADTDLKTYETQCNVDCPSSTTRDGSMQWLHLLMADTGRSRSQSSGGMTAGTSRVYNI